MFDIGGGEIFLIVVIVLLLFGPKKLPELMQGLGKGMREFKKAQRDFTEQINGAFEQEQRKSYRSEERNRVRREPDTIAHTPQVSALNESDVRTDAQIDMFAADPAPSTSERETPDGAIPRNATPHHADINGTGSIDNVAEHPSENNDTNQQNA